MEVHDDELRKFEAEGAARPRRWWTEYGDCGPTAGSSRWVPTRSLSVSLIDLISKRIRIIGSQQNGPEYLYEALDFVAQGKVKTIVETYPLAEAPKAYDRVAQGKARFRAVLTVESPIRAVSCLIRAVLTGYAEVTALLSELLTIPESVAIQRGCRRPLSDRKILCIPD
jgi:hypothetical protein